MLGLVGRKRYGRMGPENKQEVLELVRRSPLSKRQTLLELGVACSTYSRGQRRVRQKGRIGLVDRRPDPGMIWNRLRPEEEERIRSEALRQPDCSPRELSVLSERPCGVHGL